MIPTEQEIEAFLRKKFVVRRVTTSRGMLEVVDAEVALLAKEVFNFVASGQHKLVKDRKDRDITSLALQNYLVPNPKPDLK